MAVILCHVHVHVRLFSPQSFYEEIIPQFNSSSPVLQSELPSQTLSSRTQDPSEQANSAALHLGTSTSVEGYLCTGV